ncbi:MAG: ABC transporter permease [Phycisphaerales bacterium]|jgi:ABC-type Na+ efflux pump permease subunit|nr:ABC transporter permease [Phycisphaerales bacterium]
MNKLLIVAGREFRHTVLTKAFFVGSVVIPVLIVLVSIGASVFLKPNIPPLQGTVAVIDGSDTFVERLRAELAPPAQSPPVSAPALTGSPDDMVKEVLAQSEAAASAQTRPDTSELQVESRDASELEQLKADVRSGKAGGLVVVEEGVEDPTATARGTVSIWVAPKAPPSHLELIEDSAARAAVDTRLQNLGLQPDVVRAAMRGPRTSVTRLESGGGEKQESEAARMLLPMGFMMLLWIVTFTGGNYLMMSTIEEKSTRAMEVLLSAVSPTQLLAGKILGFAGVSAVMLGMYLAVAAVVMTVFAALDLVTLGDLALAGVFFVLAYLMVAAIMAGIGSAVSDITEAQSLMGPAMVILILPMLLMPVVTEDPNGTIGMVTSFIPPVAPFVMVLRIAASPEPLPALEVAAAIGWSVACAAGMIWAAGRVFRVGVLMQGKAPSPLELLRWIRYR